MSEEVKATQEVTEAKTEAKEATATQETSPQQAPAAYKVFATEEEFTKALQSEKSKAKHEILQKLGIDSVDSGKENLTKAEVLEQDLSKAITRLNQLEEENALVRIGIQEEFKDEALTLARAKVTEDRNLEAALREVTKKFPNLLNQPEKPKEKVGKVGAEKGVKQETTDAQRLLEDLNKRYRTNIKI